MPTPAQILETFVHQYTVLLTTYRRTGTAVGTPVNIAVAGDRAYFRSWDTAWKVKRIRNNPVVEIAPSTISGKPTGPAIHARASLLHGEAADEARRALDRKYPIVHGLLIPLVHRLRCNQTVHFEVIPIADANQVPAKVKKESTG